MEPIDVVVGPVVLGYVLESGGAGFPSEDVADRVGHDASIRTLGADHDSLVAP
jgi:hypothetical protein